MSDENKNPLIEAVLKLHERTTKDTEIIGGESDKFGVRRQALDKQVYTQYGQSRLSATPTVSASAPAAAAPSSVQPSTSAFKANMGQPSQGSADGSSYQPRTFDQKVSDVQKTYSVAPVGTKTSNLRVGSSGDQVSYVQRQLGITADSQYGDKTREAVMDFQRRNKLKVDGIVGDQTLSAMKRAEAMGKLQMADKEGSAAKERANFSGPPSGSATPTPIKPAATTFSGGRTGFSGNAGSIKPVPVERSTNIRSLSRFADNASGEIDPNAVKKAAEELKRRQEIQKVKESTEMSNKLIEAFMKLHSTNTPNLFEAAKKAKGKDHDTDGDKDFADVMIARMVASGMSKAEAIAKTKSKTYNEGVMQKMKKPDPDAPTSEMEKHMMGSDPYSDGMSSREMGLPPPKEQKKLPSEVKQTGKNSSTVYKQNEEVEYIDEAAVPDSHKKAMIKTYGPGRITVSNGMIHHKDKYGETNSHTYDPTKKQPIGRHVGTITVEEVEQLDELSRETLRSYVGKRAAKMTKKYAQIQKSKAYKDIPWHKTMHANREMEKGLAGINMATKKLAKEEVEIDEESRSALTPNDHHDAKNMSAAEKKEKHQKYLKLASQHEKRSKDQSLTQNQRMASSSVATAAKMAAAEWKHKYMKEEVEFSEAELEHIAAVLEAVGPTPDEYSPSAFGSTGSRSGSLSDTVSEEETKGKRKAGRPPGKYGSYKRKQDAEATTNVSIPHVFHQIRTSRPSDGHYTLQHDMGKDKKGNPVVKTARVSVKDAHNFHQTYLKLEKPDDKSKLTDKFVEDHFNVSKPKAVGITLPSVPPKRS